MQNRIQLAALYLAAPILFLSGCGGEKPPETASVTGTVTYNNKPVEGANVSFLVEGAPIAVGTTDAEGKYSIPNVPVGSAKVSVSKYANQPSPAAPSGQLTPEDMIKMSNPQKKPTPPKSEIPEKYADPATSQLTAEVSKDETANNFDFELKK